MEFLGFLLFTVIAMCGFWCMLYLITMVIVWVVGGPAERFNVINKEKEVTDSRIANPVGKVIYTRD